LLASPIETPAATPDGCAWRFRRDSLGNCTLADGRDGTGLVNGVRARAMAGRMAEGLDMVEAGHDFGFITKSGFNATTFFMTPNHHAVGPRTCAPILYRLRVALAWDSKVSCPAGDPWSCSDALEMDLDLRVYEEPGSALIAQSATTTNSYEHIDIPIRGRTSHCTPSGTDWYYRIEVRLANHAALPSSASTFFGLAWQRY
jgi:hypothetical protein